MKYIILLLIPFASFGQTTIKVTPRTITVYDTTKTIVIRDTVWVPKDSVKPVPPDTTKPTPPSGSFPGTFIFNQTSSAAIVYNNKSNFTISGLSFYKIGGDELVLNNCTNVTITNCYFGASKYAGIRTNSCTGINITGNFFANNKPGVIANASKDVKVTGNQFLNCHGADAEPYGGNFVKFDHVTGNSSVTYNLMEAIDKETDNEDLISIHESQTTYVHANIIKGGWSKDGKTSGGGVQVEGSSGKNNIVDSNVHYIPNGFGFAVAGGTNCTLSNNIAVNGNTHSFSTGVYTASYSGCSGAIVKNNIVVKGNGTAYSASGSSACPGTILTNNNWTASASLYPVPSQLVKISAADYTRIRADWNLYKR